jgi:hypothetical protein
VYKTLWSKTHGPDFLRQPDEHQQVLKAWRKKMADIPNRTPEYLKRRRRPIALAIYENSMVFNGFGAHTANDLVARMGIHPCTPVYDVCTRPDMFKRLTTGSFSF